MCAPLYSRHFQRVATAQLLHKQPSAAVKRLTLIIRRDVSAVSSWWLQIQLNPRYKSTVGQCLLVFLKQVCYCRYTEIQRLHKENLKGSPASCFFSKLKVTFLIILSFHSISIKSLGSETFLLQDNHLIWPNKKSWKVVKFSWALMIASRLGCAIKKKKALHN